MMLNKLFIITIIIIIINNIIIIIITIIIIKNDNDVEIYDFTSYMKWPVRMFAIDLFVCLLMRYFWCFVGSRIFFFQWE